MRDIPPVLRVTQQGEETTGEVGGVGPVVGGWQGAGFAGPDPESLQLGEPAGDHQREDEDRDADPDDQHAEPDGEARDHDDERGDGDREVEQEEDEVPAQLPPVRPG